MGFHLRKSFKCGPLRFNLSNSGIGASVGVKGLRMGIDSKGRKYIGGGVGMLRYREYEKKHLTYDKNAYTDNYFDSAFMPKEIEKAPGLLRLIFLNIPGAFILIMLSFSNPPFPLNIVFLLLAIAAIVQLFQFNRAIFADMVKEGVKMFHNSNYVTALQELIRAKNSSFFNDYSIRFYISYYIINSLYKLNNTKNIVAYYKEQKANKGFTGGINSSLDNIMLLSFEKEKHYNEIIEYVEDYDIEDAGFIVTKAYFLLEKWEDVIKYIQANFTADERTEKPSLLAILGEAFLNSGQKEIALETMLTGPVRKRNMDKQMCAFRYTLGKCYEANGDILNAKKQYQKVYSFDVNYEEVAKKINQE